MHILFLMKPKSEVAYLFADDTVRQGLEKMRYHHYTAIPVIEQDGTYFGTITEGDFLWEIIDKEATRKKDSVERVAIQRTETYTVRSLVRKNWNQSVNVYADMQNLLPLVMDQNFVPIVDDQNIFVGIITRKDVIRYFVEQSDKDAAINPD